MRSQKSSRLRRAIHTTSNIIYESHQFARERRGPTGTPVNTQLETILRVVATHSDARENAENRTCAADK